MSLESGARRVSLSEAQREVIDCDDVGWVGWDARGRPVVNAYYFAGFLQPRDPDRRNRNSELRTWAIQRDGEPTDVKHPVREP